MTELTRDEQLVRASKARAAIIGLLVRHPFPTPLTQDEIMPAVELIGLTPQELGALLYRMAHDGLIVKHEVDHERYKVGYTAQPGVAVEVKTPAKRTYAKRQPAAAEGAPIDVRVNEREGIITIRYAGMVISFSKE